ncbi:hypothetical protein V8F06_014535 [Rhypophila decipiens]
MSRMLSLQIRLLQLSVLSIICFWSVTRASDLFETITSKAYYWEVATCVEDCIYGNPEYGGPDLEDSLGPGCDHVDCVCSASYDAHEILSSCVSDNCETMGNIDIRQQKATSVYDRYCSSALEAATVITSTTPVQTSPPDEAAGESKDKEQEALDLQRKNNDIALGCGLGIGGAGLVVSIWICVRRRHA